MVNAAAARRRLGVRARRANDIAHRKRRDSRRGYPDLHQTHRIEKLGAALLVTDHFPDTTRAVTFKFRVDRTSGTASGTIVTLGNEGTIAFDNGDLKVITGGGPSSFTGAFSPGAAAPRDSSEVVVAIQPTTGQVRAWVDSTLVIAGTTILFPFSWATSGSVAYTAIAGVDLRSDLDIFDGQLPRHFGEVAVGGGGTPVFDDLLFRATRQGTDLATSRYPYTEKPD